jgi:radical SAM/Cys-rich protein
MPCYLEDNVNRQRGDGVFQASIRALRALNAAGYGMPAGGLILNLVYNPQGATLPPAQARLEQDYRAHLGETYGVQFTRLYTLTNMPIQRFGSTLVSKGQFAAYMQLLKDHYVESNLGQVMCRTLLSVDWQGYVYDCDFGRAASRALHWPSSKRSISPTNRSRWRTTASAVPQARVRAAAAR